MSGAGDAQLPQGLSQLDERFVHNTPWPLSYVATTDPRFFDRHFLCAFAADGSVSVAAGMGVYPNAGVIDGFAAVGHNGKQHNHRMSTSAPLSLVASPSPQFAFEIVQPFKTVRVQYADEGSEFMVDVTMTALALPWEEPHHRRIYRSQVVEDQHRYAQVGTAEGRVRVNGMELAVTPGAFAVRDHSWGIRPGFAGVIGDRAVNTPYAAISWLQFSAGNVCGYARLRETSDGNPLHVEGIIHDAATSPARRDTVQGFKHNLSFQGNSRRIAAGEVILTTSGGRDVAFGVSPIAPPLNEHGLGYQFGWADGQGHGVGRGSLHHEHDTWDLSDPGTTVNLGPTGTTPQNRQFDNLLTLKLANTDDLGFGLYAFIVPGAYRPYKFTQ